jgi:pyruvate/2-oxoglutarate dehydrogenase complex dihydrolipoamide dehydrogenase (E3) component
LIDFPGLNESYVAGTKSKGLMKTMESHEFDRIISYYAIMNNATQLMSNATVSDVMVTTTVVPVPTASGEDPIFPLDKLLV